MADKLSWMFEMVDKITGPARRAGGALAALANQFKNTEAAARKASGSMFDVFAGTLSAAGVMKVAGAVWDVGAGFMDAAVGALSFRENALAAFETLLKNKDTAKAVLDEARVLGAKTPFETRDVVDIYKKLVGSGFR